MYGWMVQYTELTLSRRGELWVHMGLSFCLSVCGLIVGGFGISCL